jgi:hypothetical protein
MWRGLEEEGKGKQRRGGVVRMEGEEGWREAHRKIIAVVLSVCAGRAGTFPR